MSNKRKKPPRVFAWHIGGPALLGLGRDARARAKKRREVEEEYVRKGQRPPRGYSASREERQGAKSRYPKR